MDIRAMVERVAARFVAETEYQKYFQKKLKEHGVSSPAELSGDAKKKFFDEVDAGWKGEKEASREAAWTPVRQDVDVRRRNIEFVKSLSSFAPRLASIMQKKAAQMLSSQGFDVSSGELKREFSKYLAYVAEDENHNKYHYYVIFSFMYLDERYYASFNCSGRIGIVERAYDLTDKFVGGATPSWTRAMAAVDKHMSAKLRKGYQPVKMVRG